jgi:hypothetical protein
MNTIEFVVGVKSATESVYRRTVGQAFSKTAAELGKSGPLLIDEDGIELVAVSVKVLDLHLSSSDRIGGHRHRHGAVALRLSTLPKRPTSHAANSGARSAHNNCQPRRISGDSQNFVRL